MSSIFRVYPDLIPKWMILAIAPRFSIVVESIYGSVMSGTLLHTLAPFKIKAVVPFIIAPLLDPVVKISDIDSQDEQTLFRFPHS